MWFNQIWKGKLFLHLDHPKLKLNLSQLVLRAFTSSSRSVQWHEGWKPGPGQVRGRKFFCQIDPVTEMAVRLPSPEPQDWRREAGVGPLEGDLWKGGCALYSRKFLSRFQAWDQDSCWNGRLILSNHLPCWPPPEWTEVFGTHSERATEKSGPFHI